MNSEIEGLKKGVKDNNSNHIQNYKQLPLGSRSTGFTCIISIFSVIRKHIMYAICQLGDRLHSSLSSQAEVTEPMSLPTVPHCLPRDVNTEGLRDLHLVIRLKISLQIPRHYS